MAAAASVVLGTSSSKIKSVYALPINSSGKYPQSFADAALTYTKLPCSLMVQKTSKDASISWLASDLFLTMCVMSLERQATAKILSSSPVKGSKVIWP